MVDAFGGMDGQPLTDHASQGQARVVSSADAQAVHQPEYVPAEVGHVVGPGWDRRSTVAPVIEADHPENGGQRLDLWLPHLRGGAEGTAEQYGRGLRWATHCVVEVNAHHVLLRCRCDVPLCRPYLLCRR